MRLFHSLRIRLLVVVTVVVLPLLLFAINGYQRERAEAYAATEGRIRGLLRSALVPEAIVVNNARQVLRIMASADEFGAGGPAACDGLAARLLKTQTDFLNLGAARLDGQVFCIGRALQSLPSVADRRWFQQTLRSGDLSPGELLVGRGDEELVVVFGYPVIDATGAPRSVVFGASRLEWLSRLVEGAPIAAGWGAAAYTVDGRVVARHAVPSGLGAAAADARVMALIRGRPGVALRELTCADGVRRIVGVAPLASTGGDIYLVVGAPVAQVFGPIDDRFRQALVLLVLLVLVSLALAWHLVERSLLTVLGGLGRAVTRIADGDFSARAGERGSVIELRALQDGFDRMAVRLEALEARHCGDEMALRTHAERLHELNATLDGVINSSDAMVYVFDLDGRCLLANRAFARLGGRLPEDMVGRRREEFMPAEAAHWHRANDLRVLESGESLTVEEELETAAGVQSYLSVKFPLRDSGGRITAIGGMSTNITERKALDRRLHQLLNYDGLTGLPNRTLFIDRLQQGLIVSHRDKTGLALFSIDLSRFRVFNDTLGQATGDAVLVEIGRRLAGAVRPGDSVARLSADEFGVVMLGFELDSDIAQLAQRMLEAMTQPMRVGDAELAVAANIGISVLGRDGDGAEELLKAADAALARAKEAGRNLFRFFAAGMDVDAERRLVLEAELRKAIDAGQLELYYQPQVDLATGRVCGTEALIRWNHPQLGLISPTEFIPVAEETGLVERMGVWALGVACRQNKLWLDAELMAMPVAVNLSARQFHQPDLVERIGDALAESGLPPALLELELTESAFIDDAPAAIGIVRRIKALGVLLALDDFGTGYSSLSYLSGFPFDKIKIDQSFVRDITANPVNAAIAIATIAMARSLNLVTLAEGVENEAQMQFLRGRQCEEMQGWLFSKALPADEMTELLRTRRVLKVGAGDTAPARTLLLVNADAAVLDALELLLHRDGYAILRARTAEAAFDLLARHAVQVIVADQNMPGMSGTEFLARAKRLYPGTVRIILSAHADLDSISEAINRGAIYHFMTKPWDDDKLRAEIREAFRVAQGFAPG